MMEFRPLVICGPSGSGKSTLLKRLFQQWPNTFGFSISHTTRAPRSGEQDGVQYHFVTKDRFEALIAERAFIEHAQFSGNHYGTSIAAVDHITKHDKKIAVLDIESQGVQLVHALQPSLHCHYLFLKPPSLQVLEQRLRARGTESEDSLQKRMQEARKEMAWFEDEKGGKPIFEKCIVNDDLDRADAEFRAYIQSIYKL